METIESKVKKKMISFEKLCELIKPGNRIFISSGPATPMKTLSDILSCSHANVEDLEIIQLITPSENLIQLPFSDSGRIKHRFKTFNVGESIVKGAQEGHVDFIPSHFAEIPYLFFSDAIGVDIAIIQATPPDNRGFLNLGIVMDIADMVMKNASLVIAEINPNVPWTYGETSFHINEVDYFIESDRPLLERTWPPYDEVVDKIGWHISNLVEDGSTIALHTGSLFDAIANHLKTKKGLRICTHVVSDWIIDLMDSGALAVDRNINHQGAVMTSSCYGTRKLYDYVDKNPLFEFVPLLRSSYQAALPKIEKLVSIINAKRIDLTGDSVVLFSEDYLLPGFDGKLNFSLASILSRNGKPIVAVRSVDQDGKSNIVISHKERPGLVRSILGATRYVATEYGIANIIGKSVRERALALIDIAHPDHREELIRQAKEAGYIYRDQIYIMENAANYPYSLETVKTFKDRLEVKFRPIKPYDEDMMRRLFYEFSDEAKYLRYFSPVRTMPHKEMQRYVNIDYRKTLSVVGITQLKGTEKIIAEARYSYAAYNDSYEMAFIVDEEFQGKGIASFLLEYLISIAKERNLNRLSAIMLPENKKMAKVFENASVKPKITKDAGEGDYQYIFQLN